MSTTSTHVMSFSAPPAQVLEVVTNPDFQVANFKAQGNPDAKVTEKSRTGDRLVLEGAVTEYVKGITGVDKSKTEVTITTFDWNLVAMTSTWTYRSSHGDRIKISGAVKIEAAGASSKLTETFTIDVKIPLVGGKVEKMVMKEVEAFYPRYEQLVKDWLAKLA
jgi:hypothetical protein